MKRKKVQRLLRTAHQNKLLVAIFSLGLSLLLVVGTTFAWMIDEDEKVNRVDSANKKFDVVLQEDFQSNLTWAPGTTTKKEITAKNVGEMPAFVRLSLYEFFMSFDVNVTDEHRDTAVNGNGDLHVYKGAELGTAKADPEDPTTWVAGNRYQVGTDAYYKVTEAFLSDVTNTTTAYVYPTAGTRSVPLSYFQLVFESGKVFSASSLPPAGTTDYWYFEKGYFYYSEIVTPGDTTTKLLKQVELSNVYSNRYKAAQYKVHAVMDAHDLSKDLFSDWGVTNTDYAYTMYQALMP